MNASLSAEFSHNLSLRFLRRRGRSRSTSSFASLACALVTPLVGRYVARYSKAAARPALTKNTFSSFERLKLSVVIGRGSIITVCLLYSRKLFQSDDSVHMDIRSPINIP